MNILLLPNYFPIFLFCGPSYTPYFLIYKGNKIIMVKTMGQLFGFYAETRANQPDNFFKLPKNYVGIEVELENIPNINNYLHKITRKNDDHWPTRLPNLEEIHDQRIGLLNFGNKLW